MKDLIRFALSKPRGCVCGGGELSVCRIGNVCLMDVFQAVNVNRRMQMFSWSPSFNGNIEKNTNITQL